MYPHQQSHRTRAKSKIERSIPMSMAPAAPTGGPRRRGLVKTARWPLVAFLATAVVLWRWLPTRPHFALPDDQQFVAFSKDGRTLVTAPKPAAPPPNIGATAF